MDLIFKIQHQLGHLMITIVLKKQELHSATNFADNDNHSEGHPNTPFYGVLDMEQGTVIVSGNSISNIF